MTTNENLMTSVRREDGSIRREDERRGNLKYNYLLGSDTVTIGKTIASINGCEMDAVNVIRKLINNTKLPIPTSVDDMWIYNCDFEDRYEMPVSFSAWSKVNLSKGDAYNKTEGERLAKERCLSKYHSSYNKKLKMFLKDVRYLCATVEHYLDKHDVKYEDVPSVDKIKGNSFN